MKKQNRTVFLSGFLAGLVYAVIMALFDYIDEGSFSLWKFLFHFLFFGVFFSLLTRRNMRNSSKEKKE